MLLWAPEKRIELIFYHLDSKLPQCKVCHVWPETHPGQHDTIKVERRGDRDEVIFSVFGQQMVN